MEVLHFIVFYVAPVAFAAFLSYSMLLLREAVAIHDYLDAGGYAKKSLGRQDGTVDWLMDFAHPIEATRYFKRRTEACGYAKKKL